MRHDRQEWYKMDIFQKCFMKMVEFFQKCFMKMVEISQTVFYENSGLKVVDMYMFK